jgi:dihydroorotate dehydrogenase electron transfer subunit
MSQHQEKATIIKSERLSADNFRLTLEAPLIGSSCTPGQFVMILSRAGKDPLLRRPFSIHQATSNGQIQIYFKKVGRGTTILAHARVGEELDVFGPLGRGYDIVREQPACLVGGGLGIAPLLFLGKAICRADRDHGLDRIILGGRSSTEVEPLVADFERLGLPLVCATDDGSYGERGFVTSLLEKQQLPPGTVVYGCGPEPMLEVLQSICRSRELGCQVSIESVMACGMGACLGCNVEGSDGDYVHVCIDGPVFRAEDLAWNM